MKFEDQEWRRGEARDQRQVEGARKEEKSKNESMGGREAFDVEVGEVEDEVETVRPQRKEKGRHGTEARPKLRRPVLPSCGGVNVKGPTSEVGGHFVVYDLLDQAAANLADSLNQGLKVNTEPVVCANSTATDLGKVKSLVTLPAKEVEQWEPLWIRQMRENGANQNLTGTPYPKRSVEESVGRAIWSPPKGVRGMGRGIAGEGRERSPPGWKPTTGDSLLS